MDSPARVSFSIMLCSVAASLLVFASGVRAVSIKAGHRRLAAYLIGSMALSVAGVSAPLAPGP
jgi:hypothetical protein